MASDWTMERVAKLEQEIASMKAEHRATLEDILETLSELSQRVRSKM